MSQLQSLEDTPTPEDSGESSSGSADPLRSPLAVPKIDADKSPVTSNARKNAGLGVVFWILFNVLVPIGLIVGGVMVIIAMGKAEPKPLPPPDLSRNGRLKALPAARVQRIQSLEETGKQLELIVDGTVVPFQEARVAAEIAGRVIEKTAKCEAGAVVETGDLLMRIDPTDYEVEVQRLTRLKEQEYKALGEVDQEMVNTRKSIEIAQQDVKLQEKEVKRQESLPSNFASKTEIDQAKRGLLQATQQLLSLQNQIELLKSRRSRLEASEQLAATQLRAAEINLERTKIVAPIDGVVVSEQADLNTFVNRGTTLVTIEDTSKVEVSSNLRMDQLHWVLDQEDPNLKSQGYDLPDTPAIIEFEVAQRQSAVFRWKGRLVSYDGVGLDTATRTVPVRVLVDNPQEMIDEAGNPTKAGRDAALVRGMFVRVRLMLKPKTPLVVIPAEAIRPGNRVWVFQEDDRVLDPKKTDENGIDDKEVPSEAIAKSPSPTTDDGFDPKKWVPGKVYVSDAVYPIESLKLRVSNDADEMVSPLVKSPERKWICEAASEKVHGGSLLVVSPLGSVGPEGLAIRAEFENAPLNPDSESKAKEQTAKITDDSEVPSS